MTYPRIDVREQGAKGAAGAFAGGAEAALPVRPDAHTPASRDATTSQPWWKSAARVARYAAVAVALMFAVPVGLVAVEGHNLARMLFWQSTSTSSRVELAERVRPFRVASDPSITPMEAGLALNRLQPNRETAPGFELLSPDARIVQPWVAAPLSPDMFVRARSTFYEGPGNQAILEATAKGLSASERAYLRALAASPVWRDYDLVARAPGVDIIGGRFRIPFGPGAKPEQRPIPSFRSSRELSYAAVSRAAYYMSIGRKDSAEMVLRSIVSYGFALIDNGSTSLEGIIGAVIVGVGRDALQRFYVLEHDPRATLPALAAIPKTSVPASRASAALSADEHRRRLLASIDDPATPLSQRYDGLQTLSVASCTNVRELVFGPRSDAADVIARARVSIARYPSERALVDLQSRLPSFAGSSSGLNPFQSLTASAASVAGLVTQNPRLVTCTRILTGGW